MTIRACLIGLLLTAVFAVLVPWNDWQLRNTLLYSNYLPPVVSLVLLILALAINPLLGRCRLAQGELVVVAVMLLGLGGVASSGLMRYLPTYIGNSSEALATQSNLTPLQERLPPDGDPSTPDWRWPVDPDLYVGIPDRGGVDRDDPEHEYVVGGYLHGQGGTGNLMRVDHRREVNWRVEPGGRTFGPMPALGGRVAAEARAAGETFLDLDDRQSGATLRGLRQGDSTLLPADRTHTIAPGEDLASIADHYYGDSNAADALARYNRLPTDDPLTAGTELQIPDRATITSIAIDVVPWYAWTGPLLAWSPLLLGAFIAMIAIAGITRRQWMEHERLPYPIAAVTMTFMEDPAPGRRLASIFRNSGFWIGLGIAGGIIAWRGLYAYGVMPIDFKTTLSLHETFSGHPWNQVMSWYRLFNPTIYFSIIALCFFLSLELSFSLWAFYLLMQFGTMALRISGVPIEASHVGSASMGGFFTMCLLILWVGRQYYWRLLRAACTFRRGDEETSEAIPYVWALLLGMGLMMGFLIVQGAPWDAALLAVLLMLGMLLVLARIVAEAGIPFLKQPIAAGFSSVLMATVGFGLPPSALIPLGIIGSTLMADPREALLPFAVNAGFLGKKAGLSTNRTYSLMLIAVVVGTVIAFGAMIAFSYHGTGATVDGAHRAVISNGWTEPATMLEQASTPQGLEMAAAERNTTLASYGVGAGVVGLLGLARMYFSAWPLHPIGFLTMFSYPTNQIWFSFLLGWMWKAGVMRYGGPGIYARLKPVAIGLIAGEALGAGAFMLIKICGTLLFDLELPRFNVLPG